jgi:Uma2 family endonuclease
MTAMVSRTMTDAPVPLEEHMPTADRFILMHGDWPMFKAMLALRGDQSGPRMAYLNGVIELMSPSNPHEGITRAIGHLIAAYCDHRGITYSDIGSWTHEDGTEEAGVEPDGCFVFGNRDPRSQPRADLAIEVVWTKGGIRKLDLYARLLVPEVWFWEKDVIRVYVLDDQSYRVLDRSMFLPDLDLSLVARLANVTPTAVAVAEFRKTLM